PMAHEFELRKCVVPSGYAIDPHKVHGEENEIRTDEGHPKVEITQFLIHHPPEQFRKPVIRTGQHSENRCTPHHQMKMGDHKIGVMQVDIYRRVPYIEAGEATRYQKRHKANGK